MQVKQDYYVYVHRRLDNDVVFYVGSGRNARHKQLVNRSRGWKDMVSKFGFKSEIVLGNLTLQQARQIENEFIDFYETSLVNKIKPTENIKVSREVLDGLFYYDETSSTFLRYKVDTKSRNKALKRFVGDEAGCYEYRNGNKHRVRLNVLGKNMAVHRVVFVLHNGDIPDNAVIDHIDGNPFNNCISNLRLATFRENSLNTKISSRNKTGIKGVYFRIIGGKHEAWVAAWMDNDKPKSRAFYVSKYGYDNAKSLAIELRSKMVA